VAVKEASTTSKAEGESSKFEMDVVHVPANINFENKISIDNFYYGAIKATKLKGSVGLKDQKAYFNKVSMAMFDGAINLNGNYSSKDSLAPKVDFDLKLNKIDVEKLSRTIKFVDKLAPIAKSATGKISANIDISTTLDTKMNPVYNTMYSGGNIRTTNLSLKNTDFLNDLADVLNVEELKKNPKVEDVNLKYKMEKGIMKISPFDIRILDIKSTIVGSTDVGKETLDMDVSMIFPRKYLSKDANDIINGAVSLANTFGAKVSIGETIDVNAKIDGDIKSPDYSLTYGPDKSKTPEEYLKKEADKIIEDTKKSAGKDLEKKATNFINNLFK
ncbi:MAG: AsmA-like C-terminal region-containing protein, partial [Flavobacteriales bacterium]|nr:AsmA-like C-terminal region-containing protein [Flavobacteriales bacterium]